MIEATTYFEVYVYVICLSTSCITLMSLHYTYNSNTRSCELSPLHLFHNLEASRLLT